MSTAEYRWTASYWDGRTSRNATSTLSVPATSTDADVRALALETLRRFDQVDMVFSFTSAPVEG
ncbi:hypothetical protein [Streptomyces scopuliridis]|uniref:Uncharacterized protein n=1 Tax=Streptomyces scopuliridis TaxID=452529 RepID=A0ACD5A054_9ACTN|nr:hypothetical protein [Streptomyces scopuliridis]WSC03594.1 hypothetical protein OG835_42645 [Streptomyces scopuliridis]